MDSRLPSHIEVGALLRLAEAAGGFGMVLHKGERDSGTILIVVMQNQGLGTLYERMPQLDGTRKWVAVKEEVFDNKWKFEEYLTRRSEQDPDLWLLELTVADCARFIRDQLSAT